jgi:hypothetical protein
VFLVVGGVLTTKACQWGIGRHIYYLTPEQIMNALMYSVLLVGPLNLSTVLGRASFCLFLLSAIGTNLHVRILLWAALISQALINMSMIILQYSGCGSHLTAVWDTSIHAKCISYSMMIKYIYFTSGPCPYSPVRFLTNYSKPGMHLSTCSLPFFLPSC